MLNALKTVLNDALGHVESAYVLGFDEAFVRELFEHMGGGDALTHVQDVSQLAGGARQAVIAGPGWEGAFASHSEMPSATERFTILNDALTPGGVLAVYAASPHSLAALVDVSQAFEPLSGETDTDVATASPQALIDALTNLGHSAVNVHSFFGNDTQWCALSHTSTQDARPGDLAAHAVARVLDAVVADNAALMPASDIVDRLASAGLLSAAARGFLALTGARGRSLYATTVDGRVQWLDRSRHDTKWGVGIDPKTYDGQLMLPVAPSAATLLLAAIAQEDTAAFRALATRLGQWTSQSSEAEGLTDVDWRDVLVTNDALALAIDLAGERTRTSDETVRDEVLARGWRQFVRLARHTQPVMPWPATWGDDELMRLWLSMSGVGENRIEELLEAVPAVQPERVSTREALAIAQEQRVRADALEDEISALQETLRQRDEELAIRGRTVRSLRQQAVNASRNRELMEKANADIKNSATFRLANQFRRVGMLTRPKTLVKKVGKAAEKRVRAIRRVS